MASGNNTAQDLYYTYNYSANLTSYPDGSVNRLRSIDDQGSRNRDYLHFEYDNRGSITNNSFNQFTYNRANQMVSAVSGSTSNQYRYDGHNRRKTSKNQAKRRHRNRIQPLLPKRYFPKQHIALQRNPRRPQQPPLLKLKPHH